AVIGAVLAQMTTETAGYTFTSESGFRTGLLLGCGVALIAVAVSAFIPAVRASAASSGTTDTPAAPETATAKG
ncbi:MFS transporter, partial [Streptomyces sp. DT225]